MRGIFNASTIKQLTGREAAGMVMHHFIDSLHGQPQTFSENEVDMAVNVVRRNPGSSYGYWCRVILVAEFIQAEARVSALRCKSFLDALILELVIRFIENRDFAEYEPSPDCPSCKADAKSRTSYYKPEYLVTLIDKISLLEKTLQQHGKWVAILKTIGEVMGCDKIMERTAGESELLAGTIRLYNQCVTAVNSQIAYHGSGRKKNRSNIALPQISVEENMPPASFNMQVRTLLLSEKDLEGVFDA